MFIITISDPNSRKFGFKRACKNCLAKVIARCRDNGLMAMASGDLNKEDAEIWKLSHSIQHKDNGFILDETCEFLK